MDAGGTAALAGHVAAGVARNAASTTLVIAVALLRGLLLDGPVGSSPVTALAWCGAILVAPLVLSGVLFARRTA